jgi:hypothetical protein
MWVSYIYIKKIRNKALRLMAAPLLLSIGLILGFSTLGIFRSSLGVYGTTETALKQAQNVQRDLIRGEQYGENYYDIGKFDASITGILSKAPNAIIACLFRPFLWEARNPVMLISGLENFLLLIFTLYLIFLIGIKSAYKVIINEPLIIFSLTFSIIFAFFVGLATANFGAMVRHKILAILFFLLALINTVYLIRKHKKEKEDITNEII